MCPQQRCRQVAAHDGVTVVMLLEIITPWRYAPPRGDGRTPMLHAGIYRVPRDIDADLAERAVNAKVGAWVANSQPVLALHPASGVMAVPKCWRGERVIVAAPGPSLTQEVADRCKGIRTIVVQDAWRLMPWADVLYGCDAKWWDVHNGCPDFAGEKWSTHDDGTNSKLDVARKYGVSLVAGKAADGFSLNSTVIHYGSNSGHQAVNLAILMGAVRVVLVGFDMRKVDGKSPFLG